MSEYRGKRAVALVSGGLDSVVSLAKASELMDVRLVLFFDYGQDAAPREREAVLGVVNYYGLPLREVDLGWLGPLSPEGVRSPSEAAPSGGETAPPDSLDAVWVPNRNGVFLNAGAAVAESYGCSYLVTGFNREEAKEFPDNSHAYVKRMNDCLELSTRNGVKVVSFTQDLDKAGIIELGVELRAPLSVVWSCYLAGERMCGRCLSCQKLVAALHRFAEDTRPRMQIEI